MTPKEEEVFFQIHSELAREGPGSRQSTRKAFSCIRDLPPNPRILDIGCGPGAQSVQLAELSGGEIYAVDNHLPFIEQLKRTVEQKTLERRVFPLLCDMRQLTFEPEFFDLIWAEGSIFIIGVEKGLAQWRPFLRSKGFFAFTEVSWLKDDPPQELRDFWKEVYPAIGSRLHIERIIRRSGYTPLHHFVLPESDWWTEYYNPIEKKLVALKNVHKNDKEALGVLEIHEKEIEIYRRYAAYYGYVFYIAQKNQI
jgi:cyclopropane fatty-acyl-phospholipid synthase-like methyltransferase